MSDIFKALADPTRRQILLMLSEKPESVNTISERFNMSRPAVSKHLKVLRDCELLDVRTDSSDGRQRNCYVQLEALKEVEDYLRKLEKFWTSKLDGLGAFLIRTEKERKK